MSPGPGRIRGQRHPTPHFTAGRGGLSPGAIVVHTTVGTFESAVAWFGRSDSDVSAHYLVALDGRVAQFVDEGDTARHVGRVLRPTARLAAQAGPDGLNALTVGIEFEDAGDPFDVDRPAAQYEAGARLIAEIARRWSIPLDREHVIGHREVFAAKDCPGNLDVDRLVARASELSGAPLGSSARIACLLPARNAAADIPGYLESVTSLGATVIALDDGSDDETHDLLGASPLVVKLLRNPPRAGYEGWNDGENRRRLLSAAADLAPDWVLFLDADERIAADDARALLDFVAGDALPGVAYGLELYREWLGRVVATPTHVYRLFAHDREHELRDGRLHFNPVPAQIPRGAWVPTTIRVRHLDSPDRLGLRRLKYSQADPAGSDVGNTGALLEPPTGDLVGWWPRPSGLPVLGPSRAAPDPGVPRADTGAGGAGLVILTPARNAAADVPGLLECAQRLDAELIALDDGSTDGTAELLEAAPRVIRLLRNPPRGSYAGWDDAGNRQRLLDVAIEHGARWALFLDADERIDAQDATALRAFVECEADPGAAYGFRVHRMVGDLGSYDRAELWVYRLFAPAAGQRLPEATLHFVPIPTAIPRGRWLKTTVRIQHLANLDEERRSARLRKYAEADPERRWQADYEGPIRAAGHTRQWSKRPIDLPVLAGRHAAGPALDLDELDLDAPVLSAIVIATDDELTIEASVEAVVQQDCPLPFEVIVVVSGSPATAEVVRRAFGERVALVELDDRVTPGRARNAGLRIARGEYVSFPGSHVRIAPGSLASRIAAHERGWAMVTGSIVNGNATRAGWASYFLDHSSALPGRPSAELAGAPAHCSYVREFLLEVGGFPEDLRAGEDTVVNQELWRRGHRAYREQAIALTHRSPCSTPRALVRHHFLRGRALGRILRGDFDAAVSQSGGPERRLPPGYSRRRLETTDERVAEWGAELDDEYRRARGLVKLGIAAAAAGARLELLIPRRSRRREQLRNGERGEPSLAEAGEDVGQRPGGDARAGVVQQHDRSR